MDVDEDLVFKIPNAERPIVIKRDPYMKRHDTPNYAMMCDRFGVSNRVDARLATALFKDIDFKDDNGELIIVDKCKVAREKKKIRDSVRQKPCRDSSVLAFSFDGRKDESLTMEKVNHKLHPKVVKESHIVVVREPKTELLGHLTLNAEDAGTKQKMLYDFFVKKNLALFDLVGICCDGEVSNTGTENGILRRFEVLLGRPLHWFVCLLHFNELPFRHLFCALEKSTTSGPRTDSGALTKLMETCKQIQVVPDFQRILLGNMPPSLSSEQEETLSTDAKYLYRIANAIHNGSCPEDLGNVKPGPIVHSRWLTKASRLLRLYVTTNSPSENLRILATFAMKVYVPMHFNVKYYNSVIYGSSLLCKYICSTQYLPQNLREIVNNVVQNNSYFTHSENVLLTMLFDARKEVRQGAIKKMLYYREKLYDPTKLRAYKKPTINFDCTDYVEMINLDNNSILSEPPFTANIPYDHLLEYIEFDNPPLPDPQIPPHIQGTERFVQLLTSVSRRTIEKKSRWCCGSHGCKSKRNI
ncbi:uncharacterized protein LOC125780355 [Bactrocera dorsalis]|uniref:Uncharacterized protein LOC125780355 n=1 Tax=Bactrocera dorsalis TaxID=27457 RepID=A0ABM3KAT9_BACDO|nr:uncharacterized protein LOC125780355 [Bactrocera dorsalis]